MRYFITVYRLVPIITILLFTGLLTAQSGRIPLTPAAWEFSSGAAEFATHLGRPALQLNGAAAAADGAGMALIKDLAFANGTIEYDVSFTDRTFFTAVHFRRRDAENSEHFYLRAIWAHEPKINTAVQYAGIVKGVNLWDLSADYQSAAPLRKEGWNRVKLVVKDRQLLAYVNGSTKPVLYIPKLDGDWASGAVGFTGIAYISNVVVRPDETPGLVGSVGFDPTGNDPRYLRRWQIAEPVNFPQGREVTNADLPDSTTIWNPVEADYHGMINLSKRYGKTPEGERRLVWLKLDLTAGAAKDYLLDFGFNDEVWMYLNGRPLYVDKNLYNTPLMKSPRGRCTIENTRLTLPLRAGENELLVGVSNFFFGWGIVARLADAEGLRW